MRLQAGEIDAEEFARRQEERVEQFKVERETVNSQSLRTVEDTVPVRRNLVVHRRLAAVGDRDRGRRTPFCRRFWRVSRMTLIGAAALWRGVPARRCGFIRGISPQAERPGNRTRLHRRGRFHAKPGGAIFLERQLPHASPSRCRPSPWEALRSLMRLARGEWMMLLTPVIAWGRPFSSLLFQGQRNIPDSIRPVTRHQGHVRVPVWRHADHGNEINLDSIATAFACLCWYAASLTATSCWARIWHSPRWRWEWAAANLLIPVVQVVTCAPPAWWATICWR